MFFVNKLYTESWTLARLCKGLERFGHGTPQ